MEKKPKHYTAQEALKKLWNIDMDDSEGDVDGVKLSEPDSSSDIHSECSDNETSESELECDQSDLEVSV